MTQQDDANLAEAIRNTSLGTTEIMAAIKSAGWVKPRTITTVEDLDTLPAESIVRDANGFTWDKWWDDDDREYCWWFTTGDRVQYSPKRVTLPATVLHEGQA